MLQLLLFSSNHKGIHLSQHWQYIRNRQSSKSPDRQLYCSNVHKKQLKQVLADAFSFYLG